MRYEVYGRRLRIDLIRYDLAKVLDAEWLYLTSKPGMVKPAKIRSETAAAVR